MTPKTLSLLGSFALSAFALPAAEAGGRQMGGGARISSPQMTAQVTSASSSRQQDTGSPGQYSHYRGGYDSFRHPHYRPRYGGFYPGAYPYSNYPFGYGYGYPYFGASAALYYYGTHPDGRSDYGYRGGDDNVVVSVQRRLSEAGYYRGAIDGVFGNGTRNAIRAYERANGLPADGRIDAGLLVRMRIS